MYLRVKLASQMSALTYLSHVHLFQGAQFYALSKLAKNFNGAINDWAKNRKQGYYHRKEGGISIYFLYAMVEVSIDRKIRKWKENEVPTVM